MGAKREVRTIGRHGLIASLEELIAGSGDAKLRHYQFANGLAELTLDLSEIDTRVRLSIQTDTVLAGKIPPDDVVLATCRLELVELSELLSTENGYYLPPSDFATLMRHRKGALTLAYGRRANDARWLFSAVGYSRLFSCLVADLEAIAWRAAE